MSKYSKLLFIGAKGKYQNMPFEILGNGQVSYQIKAVGNPDDNDDINQSFAAVEYYCLANNGQTWYFAIAQNEVYYCRQIDPEIELQSVLNTFNFTNLNPDNFQKLFKFRLNGYKLLEYGTGGLNQADGRALPDFRNFNHFEYYDFQYAGKFYSLDVFDGGKTEWFETINIPEHELVQIFEDSLRLGSSEVQELLETSKVWKNLAVGAFFLVIIMIVTAFWMANFKTEISRETLEIETKAGTEVQFTPLKIAKSNQLYTIETKVELKGGKGLNLDIGFLDSNQKLVSNSTQELYNYVSVDSEGDNSTKQHMSTFDEFYAQSSIQYTPIIKINDYGNVGQSFTSKSDIACVKSELPNCQTTIQKISVNLILYRGAVLWHNWSLAAVGISVIGGWCFYKSSKTRQKAWK